MARPKSFLPKMQVDAAARKHSCQHAKSHVISMGDARLRVYDARSDHKYCGPCAIKFLKADIAELQSLLAALEAGA